MSNLIKGDHDGINKVIDLLNIQCTKDEELVKALKRPNKDINKCWAYIMGQAKKHLKSISGYIHEDIILGWAIHYYTEDNIETNEEVESFVSDNKFKERTTKKTNNKNFTLLELDLFGE